jgi:hypothetical protein
MAGATERGTRPRWLRQWRGERVLRARGVRRWWCSRRSSNA